MRRRLHIAWMLLALLGCEGELGFDGDVSVPDMTRPTDMGAEPDTAVRDSGGTDELCVGVTCAANAVCSAGQCYCAPGFMGDANTGCTAGNPCESVDCAFGSTCDDSGACPCDPGFEDDGLGGCSFADPQFPEERTQQEVCSRWATDHPETAPLQWQIEPAAECEPGILDPRFQLDAIRRVTLYRWLVGLPAVTTNVEYSEWTQACASLLESEDRGVAIEVSAALTCHSEDAETGVGASNLLRGASSPAEAVDIFVEDAGVANLSHRRWILNPPLGATAFGFRGLYTCMYALDQSGSSAPMYVAYPVGVFPAAALLGPWSFGTELGIESADVAIVDSEGGEITVEGVYVAEGNFGLETLAWNVPAAAPGETYTVTVSGLTGGETEITYTVQLVSCP